MLDTPFVFSLFFFVRITSGRWWHDMRPKKMNMTRSYVCRRLKRPSRQPTLVARLSHNSSFQKHPTLFFFSLHLRLLLAKFKYHHGPFVHRVRLPCPSPTSCIMTDGQPLCRTGNRFPSFLIPTYVTAVSSRASTLGRRPFSFQMV